MATPEIHARLSASSSHRWLHCPPSVALAQQFPNTTSSYAEAGRLAHAIAELKARKHFVEPMGPRTYSARLKQLKADPSYERGMDEATDTYLEVLQAIAMDYPSPPFVAIETRVDYGDIAPGGFGTADCILIGGDTLHIVDYKNGAGEPVDAQENSQLMLYAWGALRIYAPIYGDAIQEIVLHIVQPHAGGVKAWHLSRETLTQWAMETVKPTAALAERGEGEYRPGGWCRFCPAKSRCTTRAQALLSLEPEKGKLPPLLSDAEVGDILSRALDLEAWVKDLKDYAFHAALQGAAIPGFKLVEGRGSRDWAAGTDAAFQALTDRGIQEAILYERKPVSVAGLEKSLGKKAFAELAGDLVLRRSGKPALVPESDKRPPFTPAAAAFKEVKTE